MDRIITIFLLSGVLLAASAVHGQEAEPLFSIDKQVSKTTQQVYDYEIRRGTIDLNLRVFDSIAAEHQDQLTVQLFNEEQLGFEVTRSSDIGIDVDRFISRSIEDEEVYLIGARQEDKFIGNLLDYENEELYLIRYNPDTAKHQVSHIDWKRMEPAACGLDDFIEKTTGSTPPTLSGLSGSDQLSGFTPLPPDGHLAEGVARIDVMLVYTPAAVAWAEQNEGSIDLALAQAMNLSQLAMDNSGIDIEFHLAHADEVEFDESEVSLYDGLRKLATSPDHSFGSRFEGYMEEVHEWRDDYGADLVALLGNGFDDEYGGWAFILDDIEGKPEEAFSTNEISQVTNSFLLVHELAHNMGSHHSRMQEGQPAPLSGGLFEYSTGWRWGGANEETTYFSIMTYHEGSLAAPLFSNPDLEWGGSAAGAYEGDYAPADNARSLQEVRWLISEYRSSEADLPVAELSVTALDIEMTNDDEERHSFTLSNNGDRWLTYQLSQSNEISAFGEGEIIYETTFSSDEGFDTGEYEDIHSGWSRVLYADESEYDETPSFEISNENPSTADQHIRFNPFEINEFYGVLSPIWDTENITDIDISFDLYLRDDSYFGTQFLVDDEDKNGIFVMIAAGSVSISYLDNSYSYSYTFTQGDYKTFRMIVMEDRNELILKLGGEEITRVRPEQDLIVPEQMIAFYYGPGTANLQENSGVFLDLPTDMDNLQVRTFDPSSEWLALHSNSAGAVGPGESHQIEVDIFTYDLEQTSYQQDLVVRTNDSDNEEVLIPVNLEVGESVGAHEEAELADQVRLSQNYPNPFNPVTQIEFELPASKEITLAVYDVTGRKVTTLADGTYQAGTHQVEFDGSHLSSGVYLYRLRTENREMSKPMLLVK